MSPLDLFLSLSQKNEERFTFYITKAVDAYVIDKRYTEAYEIIENNPLDGQDIELNKRNYIRIADILEFELIKY